MRDMAVLEIEQLRPVIYAAQRLGLTSKKVYDLIDRGVIPRGVYVRVGRQIRIDMRRLDAWIADGGAGYEDEAQERRHAK